LLGDLKQVVNSLLGPEFPFWHWQHPKAAAGIVRHDLPVGPGGIDRIDRVTTQRYAGHESTSSTGWFQAPRRGNVARAMSFPLCPMPRGSPLLCPAGDSSLVHSSSHPLALPSLGLPHRAGQGPTWTGLLG